MNDTALRALAQEMLDNDQTEYAHRLLALLPPELHWSDPTHFELAGQQFVIDETSS